MTTKKKIVFAINNLGVAGAENMVIGQLKSIDRSIFEVFFITIRPNPKINLTAKIPSDVTYVQFDFPNLLNVSSWWKLWLFFRKEKFDAVVTSLFDTNLVVRTVAIITQVPIILSSELNISEEKHRWQIIADNILARFTKRILASSVDVVEFTSKQENIPKEKFLLNYNAITLEFGDIKKNRNQALAEYNLPPESFYIVNAGRLIEQKGQKYLIEAVKIMKEKGISNFTLLIFGKGVLEDELKKQVMDLGLESQIKFMGMSTMDKVLAVSDIFILPSLWEGLSIALLQAMDSGSPIVATDISGSKEAIINGESGVLIPSGDSEAIASTLSALMKDLSQRQRLSKNAQIQVKKFGIKTNVHTIEKLALMR